MLTTTHERMDFIENDARGIVTNRWDWATSEVRM